MFTDNHAEQNRDQMQLFVDIARYTSTHMTTNNSSVSQSSKKRKLDDGSENIKQDVWVDIVLRLSGSNVYTAPDTSFAVPQRKKMNVELIVDANKPGNGMIGVTHEASGINYAVPFADIDQAFCLPVPEKAQRQWNFVVFAKKAFDKRTGAQVPDAEQMVWTMNETAPANIKFTPGFEPVENDTYVTSCLRSMNACLAPVGKTMIIPSEKEFASAIPQSHRKGEPAYHVKAHRGSKDGYLFFVSTGIIWAFKKPLALFTFDGIESISYTSVLQRTFNLVITTNEAESGKQEEVEFSMLDQADFAGIDEYIKRHNLNDASMAAERRAKKLNLNGKVKTEEDNANGEAANGAEGDEETELEKAQRELEDAEDEEEEDYDPGSEGESEGSGSDSEEDEDGGEGGDDEETDQDEAGGLEDDEE